MVLSLGHDYSIELDLEGPCDLLGSELWDVNGAIHIVGDKWLLKANPRQGLWENGEIFFDLLTGQMADRPLQTQSAILTRWTLKIPNREENSSIALIEFGSEIPGGTS